MVSIGEADQINIPVSCRQAELQSNSVINGIRFILQMIW